MTAEAGDEQVHPRGSGSSVPSPGGRAAAASPHCAGVPRGPSQPGRPSREAATDQPAARPRVVDELAVLGFSRHLRSRIGTRLFTWFFVLVFALIIVQLIASLLDP
ncbi:MAG TPA: hypothetical protein VGN22_05745 [Pseudonocardia sp.]